MGLDASLRARIAAAFPADFLSEEPADLQEYGRDWTKVYAPAPAAIAFPRTTDEVSRLLALCDQTGTAVVPSGGRTGLAGGAVAAKNELVLSLSRMRRIDPIDRDGATVRVQAGAITEAVHAHAAAADLTWPVDFASKGSSTIGGNIATNAGGVKVIRYGLTRQWVLGLEVVLADGRVLELNGALEKNNTGLDLRQLFIGSEGTLGVVTEATLKLARAATDNPVMLFGVPDVAGVLRLFREARRGPFTLVAFEMFSQRCQDRLFSHRKLRAPLAQPSTYYVLAEVEEARDLDGWIAGLFEAGVVEDGVLAQSTTQARELWALREGISESLSATGLPHKNDIALPIAQLEPFCAALESLIAAHYPGWEICIFGHVGDGNLHVNVMKPDELDRDTFFARCKEVDRAMFTLVQAHRGSISAEHGVGLLKKPFLGFSRAPEELAVMRAVKAALDPRGTLNPGKILD